MKKIWCLFHIENDYNQPKNNLIFWWSHKPTAQNIASSISVDLKHPDGMERVQDILNGKENDGYRIEEVEEGSKIL